MALHPNRSGVPLSERVERCSPWHGWPRLVFARDDASALDRVPPAEARILVVEDDFLVATEIEAALVDAGFDIVGVVASAEEAVELAASERPALVVMDIRLAGKRDGVDAALELFSKHAIRCVFATAHSDSDTRTRAERAAPLGWLQKPYSMTSLVDTVRNALNDMGDGGR
jgi:two-component system, response regulator PdtaR